MSTFRNLYKAEKKFKKKENVLSIATLKLKEILNFVIGLWNFEPAILNL